MQGVRGTRRHRARTRTRSGESPGLSVADALSWAVSHAEGRVTQAIGIALTTPIYEFATHRRAFVQSIRSASAG